MGEDVVSLGFGRDQRGSFCQKLKKKAKQRYKGYVGVAYPRRVGLRTSPWVKRGLQTSQKSSDGWLDSSYMAEMGHGTSERWNMYFHCNLRNDRRNFV